MCEYKKMREFECNGVSNFQTNRVLSIEFSAAKVEQFGGHDGLNEITRESREA
uniref:Uncharacterized protein n=1 Tax=Onchocerca volvulus TaxID=6282 RepID=A0A8R1TXB1_ONCVO